MLKHSSRIRTIFIGFWATALAGVVLIYFGSTSISKQRLALEQVVAKTYRESVAFLIRRIEEEILGQETQLVEDVVSSGMDRVGIWRIQEVLRSLRRKSRLVDQIFYLDGDGNLIFPRSGKKSDSYHPSGIQWGDRGVQGSFERGMDWELARNDPEKAIRFYRGALARASLPRTQAVLLSNIGRCYFKLGQYRSALQVYRDLPSISSEDRDGGYLDPVGLNLGAVAGDRIAACYEHLGEDRKAFEVFLDLYRRLLGFVVHFPKDKMNITDDEGLLEVVFDSVVLRYGTSFDGSVFDSRLDQVPQPVVPGNASDGLLGDELSVRTSLDSLLIVSLRVSPNPFTPNGDGINDVAEIFYDLLQLTSPAPVLVEILDLSGVFVREVHSAEEVSGSYSCIWDGRSDEGYTVPPGIYIYRISVKADVGEQVRVGTLAVAY